MKGKIIAAIIILAILVILGFTVLKLLERNKTLERQMPHLAEGESIEYFDLINQDGQRINVSVLDMAITFTLKP